jgi:hypothetical protein
MAVAKALNRWRLELIADLGGSDNNVSTQKRAIIDVTVKEKVLLNSIDAVLLGSKTLIIGRKKAPALIPLVLRRQQLADSYTKHLNMLGLERRKPVKTVSDLLNGHDKSQRGSESRQ